MRNQPSEELWEEHPRQRIANSKTVRLGRAGPVNGTERPVHLEHHEQGGKQHELGDADKRGVMLDRKVFEFS